MKPPTSTQVSSRSPRTTSMPSRFSFQRNTRWPTSTARATRTPKAWMVSGPSTSRGWAKYGIMEGVLADYRRLRRV